MILIISEEDDGSTIHVIKWLKYWSIPYIRINREDTHSISLIEISEERGVLIMIMGKDGKLIEINKCFANWYRRGDINFVKPRLESINNLKLKKALYHFVDREHTKARDYIYSYLAKLPHIGTVSTRDLNKLEILHIALACGLKIPQTKVISTISDLPDYQCISKPISEMFEIYIGKEKYNTYTTRVEREHLSNNIITSLIQNEIRKEADIRVFYLLGKCYSMAIMSQVNKQTETDFRKYPSQLRIRSIPFKLPHGIEQKLDKLMNTIHLNTGSIDLVLSDEGDFIFLEVNPVGQYDMVSVPCNYYLHKLIAITLTKMSECHGQN